MTESVEQKAQRLIAEHRCRIELHGWRHILVRVSGATGEHVVTIDRMSDSTACTCPRYEMAPTERSHPCSHRLAAILLLRDACSHVPIAADSKLIAQTKCSWCGAGLNPNPNNNESEN